MSIYKLEYGYDISKLYFNYFDYYNQIIDLYSDFYLQIFILFNILFSYYFQNII